MARLIMREAVYRQIGTGPEPMAIKLQMAASPKTEFDGKLIEIEGVLASMVAKGSEVRLQIQADDHVEGMI